MQTEIKELATKAWQEHLDKLAKKGIRIIVCPKCKEVHIGKFISGLVVCGNCGWKRHDVVRYSKENAVITDSTTPLSGKDGRG